MSDSHPIQLPEPPSKKSVSASNTTDTEADIEKIIDEIKSNEQKLLEAINSNLAEEEANTSTSSSMVEPLD